MKRATFIATIPVSCCIGCETKIDFLTLIKGAFDFEALEKALCSLLAGKATSVPEWDASNHTRYD